MTFAKTPNQWADFWRGQVGVNVIPAHNLTKRPKVPWKQHQTEPISDELHEEWKEKGMFEEGIAIVCGQVFRGEHKGKWINAIDCDNKAGTLAMCPDGVEDMARETLVEQHANPDKCHILYYTEKPLKNRAINPNSEKQIEVKSMGKHLLYCSGCKHKDGSLIDIVGTEIIKVVDNFEIENKLDSILGLSVKTTSAKITQSELSELNERDNRQLAILHKLGLFFVAVPRDQITEEDCIDKAKRLNSKLGTPYAESRAVQLGEGFYKYRMSDDPSLFNDNNTSVDSKTFTNETWVDVATVIQKNNMFVTLRDTKQKDIWYYDTIENVYRPHGDTVIDEETQRLVKSCTSRTRSEVRNTVRNNQTMINSKELFDSGIINTQNCIFDPKTFEKIDQSSNYLSTTKLPFSVDYEAKNLKLWNLILEIIHAKDIKIIMELIWNLITGINPHKKLFVFMGVPNTRKTTLKEIIIWIIGAENFSKEKPIKFLGKNNQFSTSQFIGKRGNLSEEIGNLTKEMIENQKALVGGIAQDTEAKNAQTRQPFDPKKFTFIYGTNTLGENFSQLADDKSIVTRFEILPFDKVVEKMNGEWETKFFVNEADKQNAINTIVNIVIHFKKAQHLGMIPSTEWSNVEKTRSILQSQKPKEESYFDKQRIVQRDGGKLFLSDIKKDFEDYVGYIVSEQTLGYLLKKHEMTHSKRRTNSKTWFKGYALGTHYGNSTL